MTRLGLKPYVAGETGVVVDIGTSGPRVLARADIDALPIDEEAEVPYRSQNRGVMHACGHDGHTAILLGVAAILPDLVAQHGGQARLIFQPAEERHPGGALKMIQDGVLDSVSRVTGLHLQAELPSGRIGAREGVQSANSDRFIIRIEGRGGHGSAPHETRDPIPVVSQIITAMQTIVSRMTNPVDAAVVTIGSVQSGSTFNAIPSSAEIRGTVRTFRTDVQERIASALAQMVDGISAASGCTGTVTYTRGYPSIINSAQDVQLLRQVVEEYGGSDVWVDIPVRMGGEDFAYYLQQRPGVFWHLGAQPGPNPYPHHHSRFTFDESVMPLGVWIMAQTILAMIREAIVDEPPR
ncbi:amidohydrolase [Sulfobacillus acidophilus TPY]|nr:amidohydrolase [Sulfobacillus acidophilus TPY]